MTPYPPAFFAEYRPATALDMVSRIPGFSVAGGASVRGYAGSAGNVLINGERPATKAESITVVLQAIPASAVERIDLIRGGAEGIDMQGRPVVVNVIRRREATTEGSAAVSAWTFGDGRVLPGVRIEAARRLDDFHSSEIAYEHAATFSDQWGPARRRRFTPDGQLISDAGLDLVADGSTDTLRLALVRPALGGRLAGNIRLDKGQFTDRQTLRLGGTSTPTRNELWDEGLELGLNHRRTLWPDATLESIFLQTLRLGGSTATQPTSQSVSEDEVGETVLRSRLSWRRSDTLTLEAALEGAYNFLDGESAVILNGSPVAVPSSDARVEERRAEAAGLAIWRPRSNLTVQAGLRLEYSRISVTGDADLTRSFVYPKPYLTAAWTPQPGLQLRFRAEKTVSQLSFGNFIASADLANSVIYAGNAQLVPQKTWYIEGALEKRFWERGSVTVTARRLIIEDFIDLVPIARQFDAPGNIGDGHANELAITASAPLARLGLAGVTLRGNGIWRDGEVTDPLTFEARGMSFQRPFESSLGVTYDSRRLKTTFSFDVNSGWDERSYRLAEVQENRLTHWLQFAIEWRPTDAYSLRIHFVDLDRYERTRTFYSGPRDVSDVSLVELREIPPPHRLNVRLRRAF